VEAHQCHERRDSARSSHRGRHRTSGSVGRDIAQLLQRTQQRGAVSRPCAQCRHPYHHACALVARHVAERQAPPLACGLDGRLPCGDGVSVCLELGRVERPRRTSSLLESKLHRSCAMAASSLAAEASSLFVDEVYDEALLKYTQARHLPLRRGELS
jgi:hypothetical protein